MTRTDQKKPLIQSVERAFDILELVREEGRALRSSEIAAGLKLNANTANNLIRTLYKRNYLGQDEHGKYFLGAEWCRFGVESDRWATLRQVALPIMQRLSQETEDNAFLGVNTDGKLLCVAQTEGTGAVIISQNQSWVDQLHCTAVGKIMLAYGGEDLFEQLKSRGPLHRYTPGTITDWDLLREEIETTRRQRYALCKNEGDKGVAVLGVGVLDSQGELIAGLSQSFPSYYLQTEEISISERIAILNRYAHEIAQAINTIPK
ncbi:MAG: IclR family transcriptional regulator [Phycisphaerae bacterium]|nr:IclR family transcriptional regulator [Phycisphaerae bacterium]